MICSCVLALPFRNFLGASTADANADSDGPTAATVFEILRFDSEITRLARNIVGANDSKICNRDDLETASEDLAQEYIR